MRRGWCDWIAPAASRRWVRDPVQQPGQPFPNLHVLQPNLQFLLNRCECHVEQVTVKWAVNCRTPRLMISKFCGTLYANAVSDECSCAGYSELPLDRSEYIDEMRQALIQSHQPLRILALRMNAATSYLTPPLIQRYEKTIRSGRGRGRGSPDVLERVKIARLR